MPAPSRGFTRRGAIIATTATALVASHVAAGVFFAGHDPYHSTVFPPCVLLSTTGWQCPGCGGTRSLYSLFQGDLVASLQMNPLVPAGYAAGALLLGAVVASAAARSGLSRALSIAAIAVIGVAALYATVIRNLLPL